MTVSSDWEDITWQTHLDAYLTMLRQSPRRTAGSSRESVLAQALQHIDEKDTNQPSMNDPLKTDSEMAQLLLAVSKFRLRKIAHELAEIFKKASKPRKLDIQKIRLSVKHVYADLLSMSGLISSPSQDVSSTSRIEHAAVQILAASLLIDCGEFLQPTETFHRTREYTNLASSISSASAAIFQYVSDLLPVTCKASPIVVYKPQTEKPQLSSIASPLSITWPLFIVRSAKTQETSMRTWAGQTLQRMGQEARLPKALHLVRFLAVLCALYNFSALTHSHRRRPQR